MSAATNGAAAARNAAGSRVDPESGIREELRFDGDSGRRVFSVTHLPSGPAIGGIVVCSPLHAEFQTNYRREVLLGRMLAGRGVAVRRFHYIGAGNSEGESLALTLDSMRRDAISAAETLVRGAGVTRIGFLGTRLGALAAAAAASTFGVAPLALWEPVLEGERYFKDMFRTTLMLKLKEGATTRPHMETMVEELRQVGTLDIVGYSVDVALFESCLGQTLTQCLGDESRAVLLVQLGRRTELRPEYRALIDLLEGSGCTVSTRTISANEAWWFSNDPTQAAPISTQVIDATAEWFVRTFAGKDDVDG